MAKSVPPAWTPPITQLLQSSPVVRLALDDQAGLHQAHEARHAAAVADAVREIREGMVGGTPDLLDQGLGGAATGRAADRLGSPKPGQGPAQSQDPLGRYGVSGKLGNRRPRSSVVGPGAIPGQDSLTSTLTATRDMSHPGDATQYRTTVTDSETEGTVAISTVTYDGANRLAGWTETSVKPDGSEITVSNRVEYVGPNADNPVVHTVVTQRDPDRRESEPPETSDRPFGEPGDPPIRQPSDPPPRDPTNVTRSQPADEGSAGPGGMALPFGITYNFLTGRFTAGMLLGNDQVNPGSEGGHPAVVPTLQIDPQILVVNPDPGNAPTQGEPRFIPRGPLTPGERPPNPDDE